MFLGGCAGFPWSLRSFIHAWHGTSLEYVIVTELTSTKWLLTETGRLESSDFPAIY